MLDFVDKASRWFVALGLAIFPVVWGLLVSCQAIYLGPMRSVFTKISRRYFDELPFGWGLFDLLFYIMPVISFVLIGIGLARQEEIGRAHV